MLFGSSFYVRFEDICLAILVKGGVTWCCCCNQRRGWVPVREPPAHGPPSGRHCGHTPSHPCRAPTTLGVVGQVSASLCCVSSGLSQLLGVAAVLGLRPSFHGRAPRMASVSLAALSLLRPRVGNLVTSLVLIRPSGSAHEQPEFQLQI